MPITRSAKKALRQSERRHAKNLQKSHNLKDGIKMLEKLIAEKNKKGALAQLPKAYKLLDKAAKTNILKKNTAARLKSRLTRAVNKLD